MNRRLVGEYRAAAVLSTASTLACSADEAAIEESLARMSLEELANARRAVMVIR